MLKKVKNALKLMKQKKQNEEQEYDYELKRKTTVINYDQSLKQQFKEEIKEENQNEEKQYINYTVKEGDSIQGISLMFDMNIETLKRLNNINEFIVEGMVIKVFSSEQFELSEDYSKQLDENKHLNIWNVTQQQLSMSNLQMQYCMDDQNVDGQLTVREDMILFDTNQINQELCQKRLVYNSCIAIKDINETVCHVIQNVTGQKEYLIQILLSGIGRVQFEQKFRKQLEKLKRRKKSIATVFFKFSERDKNGIMIPEEVKIKTSQQIVEFINNAILNTQIIHNTNLTKLPYVDLIDESNNYKQLIQSEQLDNIIGERKGSNKLFNKGLWASISYTPKFQGNSKCFNESQFKQLVDLMPAIFRLSNWKIKFTIDNDGSSYQQLIISLRNENPFFFTVMDQENFVFGAYVASPLQNKAPGFHGNGETFLFQKDQYQIVPYYWKETNTDFVHCDADGFSIGFGPTFGIYIDKGLYFGYNNSCATFDNPRFTNEEKFLIKHLEIWTIAQI